MGSKRKLFNEGEPDDNDGGGEKESQLDLERSIKELCREDALQQEGDRKMSGDKKVELVSKLEEARHEDADLERMARRMAWKREVRDKIEINAQFKNSMEAIPLEQVEAEVKSKILEQVEAGEKSKLTRMSMEWREAFKNDRASFLFPEALKSSELLLKNLRRSEQSKDARDLVLNLRLVSKSVSEVIDDLYSNDKFMSAYYSGVLAVHINGLEEAAELTKKLEVNPFIFRRVFISWVIEESRDAFWKEMKVILARWGKEIWSARITFDAPSDDAETSTNHDLLAAYLKLMPNLRNLSICGSFWKLNWNKFTSIGSNPLPELPYLRYVSNGASGYCQLAGTRSGPSKIIYSLLSRYGGNLESMDLDEIALPLEGHFPSLQKLKLRFQWVIGMDELGEMNIFRGLNEWGTQLKELELVVEARQVPRHRSRSDSLSGLFLELPHLETLSVRLHFLPLGTLDILLPCKSLKTISYSATQYNGDPDPWAPQDGEGIFQFPNPFNLYESNIWKLLPELKLIKMDITSYRLPDEPRSGPWRKIKKGQYTRGGYQQHCNLQNVQSLVREEPRLGG